MHTALSSKANSPELEPLPQDDPKPTAGMHFAPLLLAMRLSARGASFAPASQSNKGRFLMVEFDLYSALFRIPENGKLWLNQSYMISPMAAVYAAIL